MVGPKEHLHFSTTNWFWENCEFNNRNKCVSIEIKIKAFSKFYHIHSGLIVEYNIGLKNFFATGHIKANECFMVI